MYGRVGCAHLSEFWVFKIGLGYKNLGLPFRTPFSLHELVTKSNQDPSPVVVSWMGITQLLRAGLGSALRLSPPARQSPSGTRRPKYLTIKV